MKEANKDASTPKFNVLVVNCDQAEAQYKKHMAAMEEEWYSVPYERQDVAERLEAMAQAQNIPRVAILNPMKSLEECELKDIKSIILRNQSSEQAVREVMERLAQ